MGLYIRRFNTPGDLVRVLQQLPGSFWPELLHYADPSLYVDPLAGLFDSMRAASANGSGASFMVEAPGLDFHQAVFTTPNWRIVIWPVGSSSSGICALAVVRLRNGEPDPTYSLPEREGWLTADRLACLRQHEDIRPRQI